MESSQLPTDPEVGSDLDWVEILRECIWHLTLCRQQSCVGLSEARTRWFQRGQGQRRGQRRRHGGWGGGDGLSRRAQVSGRRQDFPVSHLCCEMGRPRLVVRMVSSGLGAVKVLAEAVCAGRRAHSPSLEPLCLVLDAGPTGPFGRAFVGKETHRLLVSGTLTHRGCLGCHSQVSAHKERGREASWLKKGP